MSLESALDLVLLRELEQVLGEYKPGGTPKVFRQAGKRSLYVAVHEHSHRDLANNTAYGWTIQFLIEGRLHADCVEQRRLARALMNRAWHVFEGHACWAELWCMKREHGLDAAMSEHARLPPEYRRATERFLPLAFLSVPLAFEAGSAIINALAEFTMDHAVATMESEPADLLELARLLHDSPEFPDLDIYVASRAVLTAAPAWLAQLAPNALGHDRSPAALQVYLTTFRNNVQAVKDMLSAVDPGIPDAHRALFGVAGMRDFVRRLNRDIPEKDSTGDDQRQCFSGGQVRVENPADTPVDRQPMPLEALKAILTAQLFGQAGTIAICCGSVSGAWDPIIAKAPSHLAADIASQIAQIETLHMTREFVTPSAEGSELYVQLILIRFHIDARDGAFHIDHQEHFLSSVPRDENLAFWRWVAEQGRGQCVWLSIAPRIFGELVCPDHASMAMPVLLMLSEHGPETCKQVHALIPDADYCWSLQLSHGFHALAIGRVGGLGFLTLAPGPATASEHYSHLFGFDGDNIEPPPHLLPLVAGAIAARADSVTF